MTAPSSIDPARFLHGQLESASPDLLRSMLATFINALMSAEVWDPRLAQAVAGSRDGQVIQYLAGAPELLARYHRAPPAAHALIDVAMDAARLGMSPALPRAFLETAAAGYLTDADWDLQPEDWLEQALIYTAKPAKGIRGPLAPVRPRPVPGVPPSPSNGRAWQLADYLDQHGRRARREMIPPGSFWSAAASYADPADQAALGIAAHDRGLYRDAAQLSKNAAAHGNLRAVYYLTHPPEYLATDPRPTQWAVTHANLADLYGVAEPLIWLQDADAHEQVAALLARDPAAHAHLDDPYGVAWLLASLERVGAHDQVTTLTSRAAVHANLDRFTLRGKALELKWLLNNMGAGDSAAHRYGVGVVHLMGELRKVRARAQVTAWTALAPHPDWLVTWLLRLGATSQYIKAVGSDPAGEVNLYNPANPDRVATLQGMLRNAGALEQVTALVAQAAANAVLNSPGEADVTLAWLQKVGTHEQVTALADRLPAAGMFDLFLEQEGRGGKFRFGREANGHSAKQWAWTDLS